MRVIQSNRCVKNQSFKLLAGLLAIAVSGCTPPPLPEESETAPTVTSTMPARPEPTPQRPDPSTQPSVPARSLSNNTVTATIYKADPFCKTLEPQTVQVAAQNPMEAVVGKILESPGTVDFELVGYRVAVDPTTKVATVDLRLSPTSRRQFISLASCEQFALFGSLKKTLTSHPDWAIESVEFTDRGKAIEF
jgi:hypothetical protein